ncbi:type II secretion system F family protein [Aminobacterium sp. MB27-C1]|uniref:type II secretion system F family protein n=1 Tax=unclassified Aminobacterium TaxID=2685012 RepID=UPI001BCF9BFE|nr:MULTISPECIES: type II secretion system F family protein [unclassified Aminobacterium]MEA4877430.1 type II secretion system F family protein [Aminobacterium sp.]WMI72330.1 type II secretion system F family protein [Aminobacterium sp. MB27-C1]
MGGILFALVIGVLLFLMAVGLSMIWIGEETDQVSRTESWFTRGREQKKVDDKKVFAKHLTSDAFLKKMEADLIKADMPLKPQEALLIWLGILIVIPFLLFIVRGPFGLAVGLVGAIVTPIFVARVRKQRRLHKFERQIPPMLDMISSGLRAGFSFLQSLQNTASQMEAPLGDTLQQVVAEISLGLDLEDVLNRWVDRVGSMDLELVVTSILIQKEIGGNLAKILENIARVMRDRQDVAAQMRALTSQGRLEGLIISILPVAMAVIINLMNPGYLTPLFTTPTGQKMLGVAVFFAFVGILIIQRIVKPRY